MFGSRRVRCAIAGAVTALAFAVPAQAKPVYNLAGRCFTLQDAGGKFVTIANPSSYADSADTAAGAASFYFKATALGKYLLYDQSGGMLAGQNLRVAEATQVAQWTPAHVSGPRYSLGSSTFTLAPVHQVHAVPRSRARRDG